MREMIETPGMTFLRRLDIAKENKTTLFAFLYQTLQKANPSEDSKNLSKKLDEVSDIPTRLPQTRVNNVFGNVTLFEKNDFKGMNLIFHLDKPHQVYSVRDFTDDPFHFNNNCSSLTLTNNLPDSHDQFIIINGYSCSCADISVVFVGYDDKNFTGHTIVCVAQSNRYNTYEHLPGFNNRLSSFKLFMAKDGQYYTHY